MPTRPAPRASALRSYGLLRGKEAKALDKHWTAFAGSEQRVADAARSLLAGLPAGPERTLVDQFSAAHATMGQSYRKGFEAFKAAAADASAGDAETAQLLAAMRDMQDRLQTLVRVVRTHSQGVALASAEIAKGHQDLSARTEQQASTLERTASSMEQLGATVQHNASNVAAANDLTHDASAVATRGGDVLARVVGNMRDINASSKKISDITGVIDGIVFQTNMLARVVETFKLSAG